MQARGATMENSKSIGDIYNKEKVGRYYEMIGSNIEVKSEDEKYLMDALPKNLEGESVLDLGCGNGRYSELFCKFGAEEVIALDLSEEMINEAEKRRVENGLRQLELVRADINDISFAVESFDLIFSRFSLMYGKDLDSIIEKIGQILKDKGLLYVLTNIFSINNPSLFEEIKKEAVPLDLLIGDKKVRFLNYAHTMEEYKNAFVKANLTVGDEKYFYAVGISVVSEYRFNNEISVKRGFFKVSKDKEESAKWEQPGPPLMK
jgi:ubiquinone/menaquinone biosynthesis C-methylase UbiE